MNCDVERGSVPLVSSFLVCSAMGIMNIFKSSNVVSWDACPLIWTNIYHHVSFLNCVAIICRVLVLVLGVVDVSADAEGVTSSPPASPSSHPLATSPRLSHQHISFCFCFFSRFSLKLRLQFSIQSIPPPPERGTPHHNRVGHSIPMVRSSCLHPETNLLELSQPVTDVSPAPAAPAFIDFMV